MQPARFILAQAVLTVLAASALPLYNVTGTAFEKGFKLGRATLTSTQKALKLDPSLPQLLAWSQSHEGAPVWTSIWTRQKEWYPEYVEELAGLAAGAEVSMIEVALTNMEVDLLIMMPWINQSSSPVAPYHCSDISSHSLMGHNEDDDSFFVGLCFLVRDEGRYVSFNYPAQLAGNAFGWSSNGVVVSINQLSPLNYTVEGAGFYFLARDALESTSVGDAITRLTRHPAFSGLSANIGSLTEPPINAEVAGASHAITPAPLAHFNLYLSLNVTQEADPSSDARMTRWDQLGRPVQPMPSVLAFLSDQHNASYPVYHDQDDVNGISTLATMAADLQAGIAHVYADGKPDVTAPLFSFDLRKV